MKGAADQTAMRDLVIPMLLSLLLMICPSAYALVSHTKIWLGINYQNYMTQDQKWVYLLHTQVRFVDTAHPLQMVLTEDSIGYALNSKQRIWLGYYWSEINPYHHDEKENRLWQQFYWKLIENKDEKWASRTRLEENKFSRVSPNLIILRELLAKEDLKHHYGHLYPLAYDEVFFRLNHPHYATNNFLSQNRLFLGVNWYLPNHSFWKIGYINQYEAATPYARGALSHILSINYVFGAPEISLPVDN